MILDKTQNLLQYIIPTAARLAGIEGLKLTFDAEDQCLRATFTKDGKNGIEELPFKALEDSINGLFDNTPKTNQDQPGSPIPGPVVAK